VPVRAISASPLRERCLKGQALVYLGKVGTGWSRTVSSQIRTQPDTVVTPKSKLTKPD
jgi:bifunctional non-homologous end joining protein LigD